MTDKIIETEYFRLILVSRNRYKITIKNNHHFTKQMAQKLQGCYFSGNQNAWVFPRSLENVKIFQEMYTIDNKLNNQCQQALKNTFAIKKF